MVPDGLDKTISTAIALSSAGLAWWAHRRELRKEHERILDAQQKSYAAAELKDYAAKRDANQIVKDLIQLRNKVSNSNTDIRARLDQLDDRINRLHSALEALQLLSRSDDRQ